MERKFVGIPLAVPWLKLHASIIGGKCSLGQLGDHGLRPHGREEFIETIGMKWNACKDLRVILYLVISTLPLLTKVASKLFIDSIQRHYKYFSSDSYFPYSIKFSHTAKGDILTSGRNAFSPHLHQSFPPHYLKMTSLVRVTHMLIHHYACLHFPT